MRRWCLALLLCGNSAFAQIPVTSSPKPDEFTTTKPTPSKKPISETTIVEFELLQDSGGGGIYAQHWLKVLQTLDVSLQVHRPSLHDKPEVKQREVGTLRYVTAVGRLDKAGTISFPGKSFAYTEPEKLKDWIIELKTYGAQGTPKGQPLWGLKPEQFDRIYGSLIKPVEIETADQPLKSTVEKFPIPVSSPLRWHATAIEILNKRGDRAKIRHDLKGFSVATALAIALNENGLGFRPNRTPAGTTELLIEPESATLEQWPIGWPIKGATFKVAPKLYAMVPIELTDVQLFDVLNAIEELSHTPIVIDYPELEAKQIDLNEIKVSFPRKMTNWVIALRQLIGPHRLTQELWQDEAGRVFVWITSTRAGRSKEQ